MLINLRKKMKDRRGFNMIELMVVVVIIGILAAVAIPKFSKTKGRAQSTALKSDLRNLATAEESYFFDKHTYTADTVAMQWHPSPNVTVAFYNVTALGWSATTYHTQASPITCAIYFGTAGPPPGFPPMGEGQILCQ